MGIVQTNCETQRRNIEYGSMLGCSVWLCSIMSYGHRATWTQAIEEGYGVRE